MPQLPKDKFYVEDQWDIDFQDTRDFLINSWVSSVEQHKLSDHDFKQAGGCLSHGALRSYLEKQSREAKLSKQAAKVSFFSSVQPFGSTLWRIEGIIQDLVVTDHDDESNGDLVDVKNIDTTPLWAFVYLNVMLTADSPKKQRITTGWMNSLRRALDLLYSAISSCRQLDNSSNSIRTELLDTFEPLLCIFHDALVNAQRFFDDDEFARNWSRNLDNVTKNNILIISETTKHIRDINETSKLDRESTSNKLVTNFGLRDRILQSDGSEKAVFPVDNLPRFRADVFIGRQEDIRKIHEELGDPEPNRIRKYHIYGRRGIGKTQIALEYARKMHKHFDAIFWIQCETKASLKQSFAEIAEKLELTTPESNTNFLENLQRTIAWLRTTQKKWLLIYDNAERNNLLTGYWPLSGRGSMLLTSRSYFNFFEDEGRNGETVECFNLDERRELFMTLLGSKWQADHLGSSNMLSPIEQKSISTLLDRLGGLPISIYHAAKQIVDVDINPTTTVRRFMELFAQNFDTLPPRPSATRDHLITALDTVWSISFANLTPNARTVLGCLSLLAPDQILIDLFFPKDQRNITETLEFCRSAGMPRPGKGDNTIQTVINPAGELQAALDELKAKGLIRVIGREISIHRTVQEAVSLREDDLRAYFDAMASLLYDIFPKQHQGRPLSDRWGWCRLWILHAMSLARQYKIYSNSRSEDSMPLKGLQAADRFVNLLANCCWYLYEIADYDECLSLVSIARAAATDQSNLIFAHLVNTEGSTHYELNMLGPSRRAMEECLEIRRAELDEDDAELAIILANLGNVETSEGNYDAALEYLEQAATIRENIGDDAAVMLALNYIQIGRVKMLTDNDTQAYSMYQKAEGVLNKFDNEMFASYLHFAYGNLELKKGENATAAESFEKARLKARQDNNWHPMVAAANYKLGCAEFEMNNHKKALKYLNNALDIAEVRSPADIDGTIARIQWKMSEVLLDEPMGEQNTQGLQLKEEMEFRQKEIADKLGVDLRGMDDWPDREKSFDLLVPGYFR